MNNNKFKIYVVLFLIFLSGLIAVLITVDFDIKWHLDGIFILKNKNGRYVVKDDLYVGDAGQIVYSRDFSNSRSHVLHPPQPGNPHIDYTWDEKDGSGIFENYLADGSILFTSLGRLHADDQQRIQGLFVGGTLPANILADTKISMNQSGMAYYNGRRWFHVWCNVNEALIAEGGNLIKEPQQWNFLGSRLIDRSSRSPVVASYHQTDVEGVPVRMERTAYFFAGEPYLVLTIRFRNMGSRSVGFFYSYGDEPWVGDYGSARGNIGWISDRLIQYETVLSPRGPSYAGMYQYGNDAIGEGHNFTKIANFLEWFGPHLPFQVSFTNWEGHLQDPSGKIPVPLQSDVRFIDLKWMIQDLQPQQTYDIYLAVGLAGYDASRDRPIKPPVKLSRLEVQRVMAMLTQPGTP